MFMSSMKQWRLYTDEADVARQQFSSVKNVYANSETIETESLMDVNATGADRLL